MRILKEMILGTVFLSRIDRTSLMQGFQTWDRGMYTYEAIIVMMMTMTMTMTMSMMMKMKMQKCQTIHYCRRAWEVDPRTSQAYRL